MAKTTSRSWFRVALARPELPPVVVAAEGEHLGVAIAAAEQHVKGSYAIACDRALEQVPLGESVGKQQVVELSEDPSPSTVFRWPRGVLPRLGTTSQVRAGYTIHRDPDLLVIEAQTTADQIHDLFLGLLERLPSADNLEIRVLDHFDAADHTAVWLTSRVDGRKILSFLDDHDVELLDNGHVEISIYVRAKKATLRLTEHKTVVWLSEDDELRGDVTRWLSELGLSAVDPFATVAAGPHLHYRAAKSRDRKKLEEYLYRQRLRRVDKVERAAPRGAGDTGLPDTDG